ncbi:hypothetical protein Fmac_013640 [Flemingia macrophylla]|uniref:Uncharacterized protein n=1 Tax=Flemingia macrophylla TaxID=520843 RepID=A0ABD1MTQ2_9FABA
MIKQLWPGLKSPSNNAYKVDRSGRDGGNKGLRDLLEERRVRYIIRRRSM